MSDLTTFTKAFTRYYFEKQKINILEAGAANAHDTKYFCSELPCASIYAFEPDPRFHPILRELSTKYQNLHFNTSALSKNSGFVDFYLSTRVDENNNREAWGSSSVLKPKEHLNIHPQIKFDENLIQVPCVNLDEWMILNSVDKFDMMWLDLQGYEYDVLESSLDSLERCEIIYAEVNLLENYEGNILYEKFKSFLEKYNFIPLIEELPWKDAGNVLFVRKDCIERATKILEIITNE